MRIIKGLFNQKYSVELLEIEDGRYVIKSEVAGGLTRTSEPMDFKTASYIFDLTLQDLEGT